MAISKTLLASILISIVILNIVEADTMGSRNMVELPSHNIYAQKIDCGTQCNRRCKLSSRPNLCKRACGTCCNRCHCVPSGTYGHYEECPCYANLKTHGGRKKCP